MKTFNLFLFLFIVFQFCYSQKNNDVVESKSDDENNPQVISNDPPNGLPRLYFSSSLLYFLEPIPEHEIFSEFIFNGNCSYFPNKYVSASVTYSSYLFGSVEPKYPINELSFNGTFYVFNFLANRNYKFETGRQNSYKTTIVYYLPVEAKRLYSIGTRFGANYKKYYGNMIEYNYKNMPSEVFNTYAYVEMLSLNFGISFNMCNDMFAKFKDMNEKYKTRYEFYFDVFIAPLIDATNPDIFFDNQIAVKNYNITNSGFRFGYKSIGGNKYGAIFGFEIGRLPGIDAGQFYSSVSLGFAFGLFKKK